MKRYQICILLLLLFSLFSGHAFAATEDFVASLEAAELKTCQCFPLPKQLLITNTGDITSQYDLRLEGSAANFAALQPVSLSLKPGESHFVSLNFFATCQEEGTYPFTIFVKTKLGLEKEIKTPFVVQRCKTLQVDSLGGAQVVDNCQEARYDFLVRNLAVYDETVDISVDEKIAGSSMLSENPVLIPAQRSKRVSLFVGTSCDQEGETPFTASFTAQTNGYSVVHDLSLVINNRDVPILAKEVDTVVVTREESAVDLSFENTGYDAVSYTISVQEGPEWVNVDPQVLLVPGYSASSFTLFASPPEDAPAGEYSVTVLATVLDTGVTYGKELTLSLEESALGVGSSTWLTVLIIAGAVLLVLLLLIFIAALMRKGSATKQERERLTTERKLARFTEQEKAKEARAALRAERIAERLRRKEEKRAEKEHRKADKIAAKEARRQERIAAHESRIAEKEARKREKIEAKQRGLLKNALLKDLRKQYHFVEKENLGIEGEVSLEEEKNPALRIALLIIFLLLVGGVLIWFFYPFFILYLPFFIIGFIILIVILILLSVYWNKKEKVNRLKASEEGRLLEKDLKKEITDYYDLVPKRKKPELEEKPAEGKGVLYEEKRGRKGKDDADLVAREARAAAKASRQLEQEYAIAPEQGSRSWKWLWIIFLLLLFIGAFAVLFIFFLDFMKLYWPYFVAGFVILIIVILIIDYFRFGNRVQQSWPELNKGEYAVTLIPWRKGLTELVFIPKQHLFNPGVVIKKLGATPLVGLDGEVYQYIEIEKTNISSADIGDTTFRFKVQRKWLQKNKILAEKIKLYKHAGSRWNAVPTEIVGETEECILYEAKSTGFSFFAIAGKPQSDRVYTSPYPEEGRKKSTVKSASTKFVQPEQAPQEQEQEGRKIWILWVAIAIILLLLIGFVAYKIMNVGTATEETTDKITIPALSEDEAGIPRQVWAKDTVRTLDLTQYFEDPDGDRLGYGASSMDHIVISFNDGIATFTPEQGWIGQEFVTFTADDGKGNEPVESNKVRLLVVPPEQLDEATSGQKTSLWYFVIAGIVILLLVITAIEYARRHNSGETEEEQKTE